MIFYSGRAALSMLVRLTDKILAAFIKNLLNKPNKKMHLFAFLYKISYVCTNLVSFECKQMFLESIKLERNETIAGIVIRSSATVNLHLGGAEDLSVSGQ